WGRPFARRGTQPAGATRCCSRRARCMASTTTPRRAMTPLPRRKPGRACWICSSDASGRDRVGLAGGFVGVSAMVQRTALKGGRPVTNKAHFYPIGTSGTPWGEAEIKQWRSRQRKQRDYGEDVVAIIDRLRPKFDVVEYGRLDYGADGVFPLYALQP